MIELLERADPAKDLDAERSRLRDKVDERIGLSAPLSPAQSQVPPTMADRCRLICRGDRGRRSRWRSAPIPRRFSAPNLDGLDAHPGVQAAIPLASGGLQAMDVDGDTIWVMTTLQNLLQEVSAQSGEIEATYSIDARVEGVVVGGGQALADQS